MLTSHDREFMNRIVNKIVRKTKTR
jgi:ATPase subunit of ABC transporter with duplicated ATPase domains